MNHAIVYNHMTPEQAPLDTDNAESPEKNPTPRRLTFSPQAPVTELFHGAPKYANNIPSCNLRSQKLSLPILLPHLQQMVASLDPEIPQRHQKRVLLPRDESAPSWASLHLRQVHACAFQQHRLCHAYEKRSSAHALRSCRKKSWRRLMPACDVCASRRRMVGWMSRRTLRRNGRWAVPTGGPS